MVCVHHKYLKYEKPYMTIWPIWKITIVKKKKRKHPHLPFKGYWCFTVCVNIMVPLLWYIVLFVKAMFWFLRNSAFTLTRWILLRAFFFPHPFSVFWLFLTLLYLCIFCLYTCLNVYKLNCAYTWLRDVQFLLFLLSSYLSCFHFPFYLITGFKSTT